MDWVGRFDRGVGDAASCTRQLEGSIPVRLLCARAAMGPGLHADDLTPVQQPERNGLVMLRNIIATELIVHDLPTCTAFYRDTLGLTVTESGTDHVVFKVGELYFFLLEAASAARMMSEEPLEAPSGGGSHVLLAARVDDVDALYTDLRAKGVKLLRPPADQPWGFRTAYFADPEGNYWEVNQPVRSQTEG